MAQFNADINLNVKETNVDKAIRRLEQRLDRLKSKAETIDIAPKVKALPQARGFRELKRRIDEVGKSLERFSSIGVGAGIVGLGEALNVAGRAAEQANASFKILGQTIDFSGPLNSLGQQLSQATGALDNLATFMQAIGPAGQATALGIGVASAAALAFAPQIRGITKDLGTLTGGLNKFGKDVINALSSFETGIGSTQGYRQAVQRLTDTVNNLSTRQDKAQKALNKVNSQSEEAAIIRRTLVGITRRLNDEQRAQNVLLEQATRAQREFNQQAEVGTNLARSRASRADTGFGAFSQAAAGITDQTAIDKSIARARAKRIEQASRALPDVAARPLALPSSEMLNAAERGIKRIRSVTDQLGQDLDYTNQEVANFINGLKNGANEAVKLPNIFNKVNQSLEVINKNFDEATAKAKRLAGGPAGGTGSTTPIQGRTAALQKLATLETKLINEVAATRDKKDLQSYNTRRKRIRYLAEQEKKAADARAKRAESAALGVGFPLLFGGGAGSIGGSFAGSFVGEQGFGGQIAGGAIGQAIDQYIQRLTALAKSMESTTGIIQGLEEAGYSVSAATESVIASYQEAGLEADAYQLAIAEINRVLGPDGASKLSDYRIETENLNEEFQKAKAALDSELLPALTGTIRLILQAKAAFDQFADSRLFKIIQGLSNAAGQVLPGFGDAQRAFSTAQEAGTPSGNVVVPEAQRLAQEEVVLQTLTKQTEELTKQQQKVWEVNDAAREKIGIVEQELIVEQNGADLANQKVYEARKEIIELQTLNKIKEAGLSIDAVSLALAEKKVALAALENARNTALARAAKAGGGGSAAKSKALQLQQQLIKEDLKRTEIGIKYLQIIKGEEAALEAKQSLLVERLAKETEVLELQRQQALENNKVAGDAALINQVYDSRIETLTQQLQLQQQQNAERLRALALERELQQLKADQAFDAESTGLSRELEDIQARVANPFGGFEAEQLELATAQARRYEDVMRDIANQEELLQKQRTDANASTIDPQLKDLERKRQLYEEMLPAIAAAEQAELRMAQTLQALQPITDGLAAGITDFFTSVIEGSKSAQEAFSDMLRNMAQALIQQGAIMIAQYIAIGIAKAFAGMGSTTPKIGTDTNYFGQGFTPMDYFTGRAEGGPVSAATPYIVGEEGQELFIPGVSGTIIPNDVFEATKAALIEDGEVVATDDSEAETASALSANNSSISAPPTTNNNTTTETADAEAEKALTANNSSISTTYNNTTTDAADAETEKALTANNSSISTTYNNTTTDSTDAETAKALERNSEIINNTLRNSEVQSALTENNKSIKNINYGDSTSVNEAFAVNNNSIQSQRLAAATTTERETMQQLMNTSSKMTVSYESTVINQQEYVTAEQHQKGVTQAAMKGRDMALASLKNSVRARKGIGLS